LRDFFNPIAIALDATSCSGVQRRLFELASDQFPNGFSGTRSALVCLCAGLHPSELCLASGACGIHLRTQVLGQVVPIIAPRHEVPTLLRLRWLPRRKRMSQQKQNKRRPSQSLDEWSVFPSLLDSVYHARKIWVRRLSSPTTNKATENGCPGTRTDLSSTNVGEPICGFTVPVVSISDSQR
jgi:hypothetical protein